MPIIIEYIDEIARRYQRDVLFVVFDCKPQLNNDDCYARDKSLWRELPARKTLIDWLDSYEIGWLPCGSFAGNALYEGYNGQIYLDVPHDACIPEYQLVAGFLENPDGTQRLSGATFCYTTLEAVMTNAHHDDPGYWKLISGEP